MRHKPFIHKEMSVNTGVNTTVNREQLSVHIPRERPEIAMLSETGREVFTRVMRLSELHKQVGPRAWWWASTRPRDRPSRNTSSRSRPTRRRL